ncbi:uncharacterized protein Ptth isoform X1 [Drosophila kikkawai]|uniref:Uncharacterized protein Ptth isoform X1 n=2 Tax=Drosophila kikkawai TaxID=30033 RepID=A0A6P4IH13_DROKI|nr:uncharacterized protein LOC108074330 [Drosophila kikkawai]
MPWLPFSIALALLILANKGYATNRYPSDGVYEEMVGLRRCEPQCLEDQVQDEQQPDRSTSKMLSAIFGFPPSTPHPMEAPASPRAMPHQLPPMYYNDFYEDLLATKRNDVHSAGCDCKVTNELLDLGSQAFPRYLMNAVCESHSGKDLAKCTHGSNCRPLEYKVKVLTQEMAPESASAANSWLNRDMMAQPWQFKTVTVTAGCFCAK